MGESMDLGSESEMRVKMGILLSITVIFESLLAILQTIHQGSLGGIFYFFGERTFTGSTPGIANASVAGQLVLRPYATFSHPNMFAGYLVVSMLLALYFYLKNKSSPEVEGPNTSGVRAIFLFITLIVGTIALALSLSRVAIFAWVLIGASMIIVTYRERVIKAVLFSSLIIGATLLMTMLFYPVIIFRLASLSFGESLADRIILVNAAFSLLLTHPFLGVGPNNFIPQLPAILKNAVILQPVHNMYLLIAAELGLPGFFLFLGFLFVVGKNFLHVVTTRLVGEKNRLYILGLAFCAILYSGLFDHYFLTLQQGQLLFVLVIGLLLREAKQYHATIQE